MGAEILRRLHKPGTVGYSLMSLMLSKVVAHDVLAQLDKETTDVDAIPQDDG